MELSIQELIELAVRKEKAKAWDEGWRQHFHQSDKQNKDPNHPITRSNPYESETIRA